MLSMVQQKWGVFREAWLYIREVTTKPNGILAALSIYVCALAVFMAAGQIVFIFGALKTIVSPANSELEVGHSPCSSGW